MQNIITNKKILRKFCITDFNFIRDGIEISCDLSRGIIDGYRYIQKRGQLFQYWRRYGRLTMTALRNSAIRVKTARYKHYKLGDIHLYVINNGTVSFVSTNNINIVYGYLANPILFVAHEFMGGVNYNYINSVTSVRTMGNIMEDLGKRIYVTTKLDGITAIIVVIRGRGIFCYDYRGNLLYSDEKYRHDRTEVFFGEYIGDHFYLYLYGIREVTFDRDIKHIDRFLREYRRYHGSDNDSIFRKNYIAIGSRQDLGTLLINVSLMAINSWNSSNWTPIDGYVIGSVATKTHYKWKPLNQITIDLYVTRRGSFLYFYAGSLKPSTDMIRRENNYYWVFFARQKYTKTWRDYLDNIVECGVDNKLQYIPYRIRHDKKNPNYIKTVKNNLYSHEHPITFTDLLAI